MENKSKTLMHVDKIVEIKKQKQNTLFKTLLIETDIK
jgi:hypothetical protein